MFFKEILRKIPRAILIGNTGWVIGEIHRQIPGETLKEFLNELESKEKFMPDSLKVIMKKISEEISACFSWWIIREIPRNIRARICNTIP